jgi:hypothetical protein
MISFTSDAIEFVRKMVEFRAADGANAIRHANNEK